jgi:hypothetical protein
MFGLVNRMLENARTRLLTRAPHPDCEFERGCRGSRCPAAVFSNLFKRPHSRSQYSGIGLGLVIRRTLA